MHRYSQEVQDVIDAMYAEEVERTRINAEKADHEMKLFVKTEGIERKIHSALYSAYLGEAAGEVVAQRYRNILDLLEDHEFKAQITESITGRLEWHRKDQLATQEKIDMLLGLLT